MLYVSPNQVPGKAAQVSFNINWNFFATYIRVAKLSSTTLFYFSYTLSYPNFYNYLVCK